MKIFQALVLTLALLTPHTFAAQRSVAADKAWKPFFAAFRAAVKRRDRQALKKMMSREIYASGGVGDDNGDGDGRDEAFEFYDEPQVKGWEAFDKVLAKGAVRMSPSHPMGTPIGPARIAPPAANRRINIDRQLVGWFAIFEFRADGRWYCVSFAQCCD